MHCSVEMFVMTEHHLSTQESIFAFNPLYVYGAQSHSHAHSSNFEPHVHTCH